ncbi:MAG: hypothetical protein R2848_05555 [Thermomicrobiales bacterium]
MTYEQTVDVLAIVGLFLGIVFAAYYQRATVTQMTRESDATVESLTALHAQTVQMQQQTAEMRAAMANESRPVLFATVANSDPPTLIIGNHGRNPASDLRVSLSLPLRDARGHTIDEIDSFPALPGWYRLVFELAAPTIEGVDLAKSQPDAGGNWEVPEDFVLEATVNYRDALSGAEYSQTLKAEVTGNNSPIRLEPIPNEEA